MNSNYTIIIPDDTENPFIDIHGLVDENDGSIFIDGINSIQNLQDCISEYLAYIQDINPELYSNYVAETFPGEDDYIIDFQQSYIISNASVSLYFTKEKISLDDVMQLATIKFSGEGEFIDEFHLTGYSEFTIIDLITDQLQIGGHDLYEIISQHNHEYMHFVLKIKKE